MRLPGPKGHTFSQVPKAELPRSSFDRSSGYKTTFDSGYLIPMFVDEILPGDTFSLATTAFGRLATPIVPIMDNLYLSTFYFFVPNRLLWNNWQRFNGEQDNPGDSTDYIVPHVTIPTGGITEMSLGDYFGLPTKVENFQPNALWFRAYNLIWNEWFRDQNLQDAADKNIGDGPDLLSNYPLRRRGKRHDYFTSSLPWPQKGDAVELPLGTSAPVYGDGQPFRLVPTSASNTNFFALSGDGTTDTKWTAAFTNGAGGFAPDGSGLYGPGLYADLSDATAATINQLRQAFQIQRLLERDARGGTRYTEILKAHFGVTSPDARLQRPEYLGGGQTMVNVAPVAQTSSTDGTTPQGNLAAFGTVTASRHGFTKSFTEHGVVIGLMQVRADLSYQQGLPKMWSRRTRFDFYWPALAHIGEQAVLKQEIMLTGTGTDDDVWGYQERYAEYRYKPSQVTGLFRSNAAQSLDFWHLSQEFSGVPTLNDAFIQDNPPVDRVIAVPAEPHFIMDIWHQLRCARIMPLYGVPGLIDHF